MCWGMLGVCVCGGGGMRKTPQKKKGTKLGRGGEKSAGFLSDRAFVGVFGGGVWGGGPFGLEQRHCTRHSQHTPHTGCAGICNATPLKPPVFAVGGGGGRGGGASTLPHTHESSTITFVPRRRSLNPTHTFFWLNRRTGPDKLGSVRAPPQLSSGVDRREFVVVCCVLFVVVLGKKGGCGWRMREGYSTCGEGEKFGGGVGGGVGGWMGECRLSCLRATYPVKESRREGGNFPFFFLPLLS